MKNKKNSAGDAQKSRLSGIIGRRSRRKSPGRTEFLKLQCPMSKAVVQGDANSGQYFLGKVGSGVALGEKGDDLQVTLVKGIHHYVPKYTPNRPPGRLPSWNTEVEVLEAGYSLTGDNPTAQEQFTAQLLVKKPKDFNDTESRFNRKGPDGNEYNLVLYAMANHGESLAADFIEDELHKSEDVSHPADVEWNLNHRIDEGNGKTWLAPNFSQNKKHTEEFSQWAQQQAN